MKSVMYLFEELFREKCGPAGIKILKLLEGKENISEFILSDQLDMNINELRTYLYKLSESNLIYSTRKKDKQKGWYVYYWTLNLRHARDLVIKYKEGQLQELKSKLNNKEVPKYICPNGCTSLNLEDAMEIEFKCPECSSLLKLREVKYDENVINGKIKEVEHQLEELRQALIVEVAPKEKKEMKKEKRRKRKKLKKIKKKRIKRIRKKIRKRKKIKKQKQKKVEKIRKRIKIKKHAKKKKIGIFKKLKKRIRF